VKNHLSSHFLSWQSLSRISCVPNRAQMTVSERASIAVLRILVKKSKQIKT